MELYIFDKDINVLGIVENYSSLRWLNSYNGLGEFQLVAEVTKENIELIKLDNLLFKTDSKNCMVIEDITIKGNEIEVRGRSTKKYLTERIVLKQANLTLIERDLRKIITDNGINNRPIKNLILGANKGYTDTTSMQITYNTLNEAIENFKEFGYEINLDIENKKHIFELYKGNDISDNVVFAEEFDNLVDSLIMEDNKEYKNFAIVGGQGEGTERTIINVDNRKDNEVLREIWIDAKDIEKVKRNEDGTETPYTETEYKNLLIARGKAKLAENIEKFAFTSSIVLNSNYIYKTDYNLGDIVYCKNFNYGIQLKVRITEIQEIYDSNGYQIIGTLGEV